MSLVYKDRVRETSTTTGTGDLTLAGAPDSTYQAFGTVLANGDTCDVGIFGAGGFEVCRATYVSATNKLQRGTIYDSSNAGALVNFGAGDKTIILGLPGQLAQPLGNDKLLRVDAAQTFTELEKYQAVRNLGVDFSFALLALYQADDINVAFFSGPSGNRYADSFEALTYVNTGGSTNLDSGTSGQLKPSITAASLIPRTDGTTIGNHTVGGGLAAAFDGTTSQAAAAGAQASAGGGSPPSGYGNTVGKDWGSGVTHTISRFIVYGPNNNSLLGGTNSTTLKLQGSTDNFASSIVDLTTDIAVGSGTSIVVDTTSGITTTTAYRYHRINIAGNNVNGISVAELQFYQLGSTDNATVKSTGLTAASAPTQMRIVALVEHTDTATAGTDYKFKVSRNGGTNLSGYLTLNDRFTIPGGAFHVIESDVIDVSGITTGTTPFWQWETLNNKLVKLHGLCLYWQ